MYPTVRAASPVKHKKMWLVNTSFTIILYNLSPLLFLGGGGITSKSPTVLIRFPSHFFSIFCIL